jgi:hypothetical protein
VRNVGKFDTQLREGLEKYINVEFDGESESDLEELGDRLEDLVKEQKSDFYRKCQNWDLDLGSRRDF